LWSYTSILISVGVTTGYGLDFPGSIPFSARFFSVQTDNLASYPVGTVGSFPGVKAAGA
jgi:hypothetical protein